MKKKRLWYIENLRVALMILVVLQHAVRAYGSVVWWFVDDAKAPLLERFTAVNSSFFMSLFFFISFYFMPSSYDRKGFWQFHKDRFLRLFVPLVAYVTLLYAPLMYAYFIRFRALGAIPFTEYFTGYFLGLAGKPDGWAGPSWPDLNFGQLWFVEHLLLYGLMYSAFRFLLKGRIRRSGREFYFPSTPLIAAFASVLALASFAIRLRYPLYRWEGFLGFIQAEGAHFPFYSGMFFAALFAYQHDWLAQMPDKNGRLALAIGLVCAAAIAFFPVDGRSFGGFSPTAFAYAFFEAFACVGLVIGLLYLFRRRFNAQNAFMSFLSKNSYMVFILHMPIVVIFQYLLLEISINPYAKFALVSICALPVTFCASALLRKIPFVGKYV